jgi:hypothetical protein
VADGGVLDALARALELTSQHAPLVYSRHPRLTVQLCRSSFCPAAESQLFLAVYDDGGAGRRAHAVGWMFSRSASSWGCVGCQPSASWVWLLDDG